jgi:hypothetical protein
MPGVDREALNEHYAVSPVMGPHLGLERPKQSVGMAGSLQRLCKLLLSFPPPRKANVCGQWIYTPGTYRRAFRTHKGRLTLANLL